MASQKTAHLPPNDFKKLREGNFFYADKTHYIVKLLENESRLFISRPQGFGKSLTISLLENLYHGERKLFNGLAIERHLDDEIFQPHPVITLDMSIPTLSEGRDMFEQQILAMLDNMAKKYAVKINTHTCTGAFAALIKNVAKKHDQPVVLIDEFDYPLIKTNGYPAYREEIGGTLLEFYQQLNVRDNFIHVAYLTGNSEFSESDMDFLPNNILDLSPYDEYCSTFGFLRKDVIACFSAFLHETANDIKKYIDVFLSRLEETEGGCIRCGNRIVYNPAAVIAILDAKGAFTAER